jgi:four helix bundle protein
VILIDFGFSILDFGLYVEGRKAMDEAEFKRRTKELALRTIRLIESLPPSVTANILGKQLLRSSTSVGANYRAACRSKSIPDMINKLRIVEEEADESMYWLELIGESNTVSKDRLSGLITEYNEIVAMVVSSQKTLQNRSDAKSKIQNRESKIQ